jgi:hypothetical protein
MKRFAKHLMAWACLIALLLSVSPGAPAKADAYPAVSLKVPSYKQTDSRWASAKVGNSGKTIGKIGCALTSLAMTESYRTGSTITPLKMASRLSFDKSGSLYWPSNYVIPDAIPFSQLYRKLKQGVPVIVGARKASGGTHFVVITGFAGGDRLSASGFTINDPGSSTRTRLSQFLAAYPTLYRRLYYTN